MTTNIAAKTNTGVMVAFFLSPADAAKLALDPKAYPDLECTSNGEMHLTLAYLGDLDETEGLAQMRELVQNAVAEFARFHPVVITGNANGLARFSASEGNDTNALVALYDSPSLANWRSDLMWQLRGANLPVDEKHSYTPHITLAYTSSTAPMPTSLKVPNIPLTFSTLTLAWGGERTTYDLTKVDPTVSEIKAKKGDIQVGDFVKWAGHTGYGHGKVLSIHTDGKPVPDLKGPDGNTDITVIGDEKDPAARIQYYKPHDYSAPEQGYTVQDEYLAHRFSSLTKIEPLPIYKKSEKISSSVEAEAVKAAQRHNGYDKAHLELAHHALKMAVKSSGYELKDLDMMSFNSEAFTKPVEVKANSPWSKEDLQTIATVHKCMKDLGICDCDPNTNSSDLPQWTANNQAEREQDAASRNSTDSYFSGKAISEPSYAVKSLGNNRIGSYLVLWGDSARKDLEGDYFDATKTQALTDIFSAVGKLPGLYHHGLDPEIGPEPTHILDTIKADKNGLWVEGQLNKRNKYMAMIKQMVKRGALSSSSGSMAHQVKRASDGLLEEWPIYEWSLTPTPAEPRLAYEYPVETVKSFYKASGIELPETILAQPESQSKEGGEEPRRSSQELIAEFIAVEFELLSI